MHRKFVALLLAMAALSCALLACTPQAPASDPTTTGATLMPGINTTPDEFVGFEDTVPPTAGGDAPTQEATQPTQEATQPTQGTTQPTTPPPTASTDPTSGDADAQLLADAQEYVAYMNLDAQAQYEIFKSFSSIEEFNAWFLRIEAAYKTLCTDPDYDGGGLVLPE